jgi:hypothetical protein
MSPPVPPVLGGAGVLGGSSLEEEQPKQAKTPLPVMEPRISATLAR